MFELFAAWREVAHLAEWTGVSAGALVALAVLAWTNPQLLRLAIGAAIAVAIGWLGLVHGEATGAGDVRKEWDAARAAAAGKIARRDVTIARGLEAAYQPRLEQLQRESEERKQRADAYEKQILALLAKPAAAAGHCELGDAALRVHGRR